MKIYIECKNRKKRERKAIIEAVKAALKSRASEIHIKIGDINGKKGIEVLEDRAQETAADELDRIDQEHRAKAEAEPEAEAETRNPDVPQARSIEEQVESITDVIELAEGRVTVLGRLALSSVKLVKTSAAILNQILSSVLP